MKLQKSESCLFVCTYQNKSEIQRSFEKTPIWCLVPELISLMLPFNFRLFLHCFICLIFTGTFYFHCVFSMQHNCFVTIQDHFKWYFLKYFWKTSTFQKWQDYRPRCQHNIMKSNNIKILSPKTRVSVLRDFACNCSPDMTGDMTRVSQQHSWPPEHRSWSESRKHDNMQRLELASVPQTTRVCALTALIHLRLKSAGTRDTSAMNDLPVLYCISVRISIAWIHNSYIIAGAPRPPSPPPAVSFTARPSRATHRWTRVRAYLVLLRLLRLLLGRILGRRHCAGATVLLLQPGPSGSPGNDIRGGRRGDEEAGASSWPERPRGGLPGGTFKIVTGFRTRVFKTHKTYRCWLT